MPTIHPPKGWSGDWGRWGWGSWGHSGIVGGEPHLGKGGMRLVWALLQPSPPPPQRTGHCGQAHL